MSSDDETTPALLVENRILMIRGHKVLLDSELADLYQVQTKALNRAVKRNRDRFPADFMFQLTAAEATDLLKYQSVTSNQSGTSSDRRGGRRYRPYVFTEQGIAMLSGVLTSKRAVEVNIVIMRIRQAQATARHTRRIGPPPGRTGMAAGRAGKPRSIRLRNNSARDRSAR